MPGLVREFVQRLDRVLAWDAAAVDETTKIRKALSEKGTQIGYNDASIAGHAIASGAVLVTHNTREFERVAGLQFEDWYD
ncbi:MAG: type II toxin-antitoxin system VapC family toxin [Burkholderia gladioli]